MNAPPGVDSESSSGEAEISPPYSPVSPDNKPHFSLKALFLSESKLNTPTVKDAKPAMGDQFVGSGIARAPSPIQLKAPKKKVRIHVKDEDHPDSPKDGATDSPLDLVGSDPISPMSVGDAGSPWAGAMSPMTSSSPGQGPPANEVFDLLRQLLVDRNQSRDPGGGAGARLEPVDESSDSDSPPPPDPFPPPRKEAKVKKKPSRILAKLSKLTSPLKTTHAPPDQDGADSSSSFSATDGFSPSRPSGPAPPDGWPRRRPTPANAQPAIHPSSSQSSSNAWPTDQYIDPSNRLPDGRKAHGLAEEYFHPETAIAGDQPNHGVRDDERRSLLPYLSQAPASANDTLRQARDPPAQPWLYFPSPWQAAPQTSPQPPYSAPIPAQQSYYINPHSPPPRQDELGARQSHTRPAPRLQQSGHTYYDAPPPQAPYPSQAFNNNSHGQYYDQSGTTHPPAPYQHYPQAYHNTPPSHAPYSPPWTSPAPAPTYPQWHFGYYPPHQWSYSPPSHPPPFPHPPALQPWQPYYPPPGYYPYGPHYPPSQSISHLPVGQDSVPIRAHSGGGPGPLSPLESLPNPHDLPTTTEERKSSTPALQADGLRLRPANEAKSPVKTRLHGLPGSIKVKVEDGEDAEEHVKTPTPSDGAKEQGALSTKSKVSSAQTAAEDRDKLRNVVAQREGLEKRIAQGKIDKEKGQKDMERLTNLRDHLQASTQTDGTSNSPTKTETHVGPSPPTMAEKSPASEMSEVTRDNDPKARLKLVLRQREGLKKQIAEGTIDRGKGKTGLDRLTQLRDRLQAASESSQPSGSGSIPPVSAAASSSRDPGEAISATNNIEAAQPSAGRSVAQLKEQIAETEKRMVKVKSKMLDRSLEREEGEQMLAKLDKSRKKLRETLHAMEKVKGKVVVGTDLNATGSSKTEEEGRGQGKVKPGEIEEREAQLAQLEPRMKRINQKLKEGTLSKEDAEKEMKKLVKAREALLSAGAEGSTSKGSNKSRRDEETLDPEILERVLSEVPSKPTTSRKVKTKSDVAATTAQQDSKERTRLPAKARKDVDPAPRKSHGSPDQAARREEAEQSPTVKADPRPSSMHIPGAWQNPSLQPTAPELPLVNGSGSKEVTWSKCLVSLAHCIDLGSDLSAHLLTKHQNNEQHARDGQNFLVVEVLPRLLTSLVLQRDIVSSMRGILGEQHSEAMGAFLEHILVVKKFLEVQHAKQKERAARKDDREQALTGVVDLHSGLISPFESGSLQAILEHLLGLSDFLTPHLLKTLRDVLQEWKEDGLSITSIIHIIMTLRKELDSVSETKAKRLKEDKAKVEPTGTLDLLDKLLRFIDGDGRKRRSIQYEPASPRQPDEESRPGQHASEGNLDNGEGHVGIKDKVARVLHIDRGDKTAPSGDGDKRDRADSSGTRKLRRPEDRSARSARVEDASDSSSLPSTKSVHREPLGEKEIKLPSVTEEFLRPTKKPPRPFPGPAAPTSRHDHHSTVVRPPGPSPEAKGSHHHAIVDPDEHPDLRKILSRGMSSQSKYSQDSAGTIESDEEAKELLATADSGPQPVDEPGEEELVEDLLPSDEQVRMAREVLQDPTRPAHTAHRVA